MSLFDAYKKTESLEGLAETAPGEEITNISRKRSKRTKKKHIFTSQETERILKASVESVESAVERRSRRSTAFIGGG